MTFLCTGSSGLLAGVGDDAKHIAAMIQEKSPAKSLMHKHYAIL
jgi:hypothetical protein